MDQASFAAALLLWGALPGLALAAIIRVDWTAVERAAAAPGLSLALVAVAAYAAELAGLAVTPASVLVMVAVMLAGLYVGQRARPPAVPPDWPRPTPFALPSPRWLPWLIFLLPQVIANALEPISTVTLLPPSLHDGLDHANWFRLVLETHSLDPHEVLAPPLAADGSPTYYPWGLHGWLALVAQTTTLDPIAVLMQALVLISAMVPLSVFVFVAQFTGRGWPAIGAAALSLLFWWLPYQAWGWGGYPLLAGAVAALPISRLALEVAERWNPAGIAVTGAAAVGLLTIHPSQAFAALIIATAVSLTLAAERLMSRRTALLFLAALAAAAAGLTIGAAIWDPLRAFLDRSATIGAGLADDARYAWPVRLYLDSDMGFPRVGRIVMGALYVTGAVVACWFRPTRPLFVLHLVFSLLIPAARAQTSLTTLWYHSPERLWYSQFAVLPAFAALGVAAVVMGVERLLTRWRPLYVLRFALWPAALWAIATVVYPPYANWASLKLFQHAQRNPNRTITDRRILADYRWIAANVPAGQVLFNSPADWGLPLPFTGRRTVFWSGGQAVDPITPWYDLLDALGQGDPRGSQAAAELRGLGIEYVYEATLGPILEQNRQSLDLRALKATSRMQLVYESQTAAVFRIPDDGAARFGIRDSDRIQFLGFHPAESRQGREWRWTAGDGTVRIRTAGLPAGDCVARVHGPPPDHYFFRVTGEELPFTSRGYEIPARLRTGGVLEIFLRVPEQLRRVLGDGASARRVGVRVTNVELRCG
jgi:hypothetical protein